MTEQKHSRGPWRVRKSSDFAINKLIEDQDGKPILYIYSRENDPGEQDANMNAVLAIPDMLEALIDVVGNAHPDNMTPRYRKCWKAIQKALGKEEENND